jgi:hypothetical protein
LIEEAMAPRSALIFIIFPTMRRVTIRKVIFLSTF